MSVCVWEWHTFCGEEPSEEGGVAEVMAGAAGGWRQKVRTKGGEERRTQKWAQWARMKRRWHRLDVTNEQQVSQNEKVQDVCKRRKGKKRTFVEREK